ncbi:MAG: hypothetical protein ACRDH1_12010 [Actinomycetota bacterium]
MAPSLDPARLRAALGGPLPAQGTDAHTVIEQPAAAVEPALMNTAGPRYFGYVMSCCSSSCRRSST